MSRRPPGARRLTFDCRFNLRETKVPGQRVAMVNQNSNGGRPPVLAHERFVQHRESLVGLGLRHRFSRIFEMNLWGGATSVSGSVPKSARMTASSGAYGC
jgi:hypothetical protein